MEIRRTSRPYLWVLLMLLGLWLGTVLAKGASNQTTTSQTWQYQQQQQRYRNQLNESLSQQPEELEILETTSAIVSSPHESHLTRTSVIFGLTKVANESSVSQKCHAQLRQMQRGILGKQPWAMKVLDASGTKPSGFVYGQNYWLGSREACRGVQRPVGITLSKNFDRVMHYGIITQQAPFDMDYRVLYLRHSSPWQVEIKLMSEQIIHIGLCLPSACSSEEVKNLAQDYVAGGMFTENEIFDIRPEVVYMKDLQLKQEFFERASFRLLVACVLVTGALMLCAQQLTATKKLAPSSDEPDPGLAPAESEIWRGLNSLLQIEKLQKYIPCWDIPANWAKIFAVRENSTNEIPLMNGLRSVCAIWIMVFHVVWFMYFTVHNKTVLISYAEQAFFQYVSSAPLLVDVFFTISGFLQTFNFLRNSKQLEAVRQNSFGDNLRLFGKLLFHRYLRLGPLYLVVMTTVDLVYAYIGDVSVYHINERFDEMCSRHWWRNLLFIQNFFDHRDMCANWSWSLACEMQFFILANALLFLYVKYPKVVKTLVASSFVATIAWSYSIGLSIKFQLSFDSAFATGTEIYTSPFVRVLPYILGAATAWLLQENRIQVEISEPKERFCWHFALFVFFACIYSTVKRDLGPLMAITLFVMGRLFFSLSVCWMIARSCGGRGVWWSRLLEAKGFQHVSRLSYAIYLLNPLVIALFYSLTNASTHADPFMLCVVTCGFAVIVYLASILFSLAFEVPFSNLSSLLNRRQSKPKTA
ncbi:nose resistant to fluoxetine protein 6 [Drosophila eugracilis]|uniref:nose resistant to fluoxetine protein 6 n=1 Tax=Drosophila eugracilis TaxID=29029 RepID=UPI0007E74A42|nr:nose resistant to fluoxetine protein 6 [Drosophila eugracilis]XP_017071545.1 nose resistant to fluoxetine protein 6 [Drosophila eugracilis]XP_017071546.1 nose resistant to fluoxetine protein 6 [Drosophila eugracilis]XP_017071548.1 nose resistant to fluoxetine protein 6 [Drosophila eugracilis]XP_017071549.1 nose resistant to fluoxetine protein 6 [Drosophila eugracilis]